MMTIKTAITVMSLVCSAFTFAQSTLTIEISGLKSNKGEVIVSLVDAQDKPVLDTLVGIEHNKATAKFHNLSEGEYAFKFIHDENSNKELDTNFIGFPKEGFGFSNNAKGSFGPPDFEKTIFKIKNDTTQKCDVIYL